MNLLILFGETKKTIEQSKLLKISKSFKRSLFRSGKKP